MDGSGTIEGVGSGAFGPLDVTWASRAEAPEGRTSPEELIAAAWASCFSMALSHALAGAGTPPERLETSVTVTFQPGEGIVKGAIHVVGTVLRPRPRGVRRAGRGREGELPRLEGADRGPRGHARRDARDCVGICPPKSDDPGCREPGTSAAYNLAVWPSTSSSRSSSARTTSSSAGWPTRPSTPTTARRRSSAGG